jgi:N-carbamoyl-L-amino-acid hydrolase
MTVSRMTALQQRAARIFDEVRAATRDPAGGIGVTREAFGESETRALQIVERHAVESGLRGRRDAFQNLWIEAPQDAGTGPAIVIGSHLDSVPQGGNFDGLAGVVAGLLVLREIQSSGSRTDLPVRVLGLRGEESAWYGKPYLGSLPLLGKLGADELKNRHRGGGKTLGEAMRALGIDVRRIEEGAPLLGPAQVAAYLELHIEQGPVMVARQWPVAAVTGIRGNIRHNAVRCIGETGHSGAVPRWLRKDAMLGVADLLARLDEHWRVLLQMGMDLVMTVGICNTPQQSQAVSVIPGEVRFSFEVRSQDSATLDRFYQLMRDECAAVAKARGLRFEFDRKIVSEPAVLSARLQQRFIEVAARRGLKLESIPSGAGHDAAVFANAGIPSAMLFVRNQHGSHNPDEAMDLDDFTLGASLLLDAVTAPGWTR